MSDRSVNFGDTLSSGIQDVAALLPLLGTEQVERHIGSSLEKGYLYSATATLSLFRSLGAVKVVFATCVATITYPFYGGHWLDDAGFSTPGSVSSMVTIDKETGRYGAELRVQKLLEDQHIDDPNLVKGFELIEQKGMTEVPQGSAEDQGGGLNSITKKNRFPLPLVDDLLDSVQGCKIFTVIDLKSAYSHLRIREGDEWKTAFRTHLGLFEHLIVPYGLTNAPAAWQSFIQDVLRDILGLVCVVYLDDILIFSKTQEEHDQHVRLVLERLRNANLCANAKKCEFDKAEVEYLGYIVSAQGISMNPKKLDTILSWPEPRKLKDLQSFLGFMNFYRRFIHDYSRITLPLTTLTKKSITFNFSDECRGSFEELKRRFTSAPVLRHFDPHAPCYVSTDGSDFTLSGIVQQADENGDLHPISFFSRKFAPAEINYDVYDKELLAIVETFREHRHWLLGSPFSISVICDHKNLVYFITF
ncbi:retrotransposon nucleocapsid protein [Moniliophthora roreri]|nr:retrotransposon nucleocapsid protein [Moniliophthora roreri]